MSRTQIIQNRNGAPWLDQDGEPLHAHGGGILYDNGFYYLFGENRTGRRKVSCYRSRTLSDWEWRGDVLTLDSDVEPLYCRSSLDLNPYSTDIGANIERPKVLFNAKTGQYVMWMHWENGNDYRDARCAVATCDTVDGDYTYRGSFNPIGHMSRDCTLFQDDDGTAYFLSAARENADLLVYRLSDDYLVIDELVKTLWPGQYREAPAVMKRDGVYFMTTSACTGWHPNPGAYAYADSLTGRWSPLLPLGDATTYDTQPTFIVPIRGTETTSYLYLGDRWDPTDYQQSGYALLLLEFPDDRTMEMRWADTLEIDFETGRVEAVVQEPEEQRIRIRDVGERLYLAADGEAAIGTNLHYQADEQIWAVEPAAEGSMRLRNVRTGRYLGADSEQRKVMLAAAEAAGEHEWSLLPIDEERGMLIHRQSGLALAMAEDRQSGELILAEGSEFKHDRRLGSDPRWFLLAPVRGGAAG